MAIAVVQSAQATGAGSTVVATLGAGTTEGNLIVVLTSNSGTAAKDVSDNKGGGSSVYTLRVSGYNTTDNRQWAGAYDVENCAAGITQITVASNYARTNVHVIEISGYAASGLDVTDFEFEAYNAGTTWAQTAGGSTTQANEIILHLVSQYYAFTPSWTGSSGYTAFAGTLFVNGYAEYKITSATETPSPSGSLTGGTDYTYSHVLVTYKEAAAGGGSAAITGTATASITEADIVAGGKTIIITLTGDTWAPA